MADTTFAAELAAASAAGAVVDGVVRGASYIGHVATRTRIPNFLSAANTQAMTRRGDWIREDVTSLRLVFANFYATATGEALPGATRSITASIEYPLGTFTQVLFSGSATGTMTDGQAQLVSDPVAITIPRNAFVRFNTWQSSSAGMLVSNYGNRSAAGDQATWGTSVADTTMTTWTGANFGFAFGPSAVIANTARPTIAAIGDSEVEGVGETNPASAGAAYVGVLAPQLAPRFGFLDLSKGSVKGNGLAANFTRRATYLQYVTHAINELGTNDLADNPTVAQLQTYDQQVRGLAPNLTWFRTTIMPRTASTTAISALSSSGTTATATIGATQAATLKVGQNVTVAGAVPAGYNGTVAVTAISGTQISYTLPSGGTGLATATTNGTMSDLWASLAFQTQFVYTPTITAYNEALRGGSVGYEGLFDISDAVSSARDSGLIKVPPQVPAIITLDGLHFNVGGWGLMFPYVDPNKIKRVGTVQS